MTDLGYTEEKLKIKGNRMKPAEFDRFLRESFASFHAVMKTGAYVSICHASSVQREFQNAIESAGARSAARSSGRRIRSRGDSDGTSSSTSRSSIAM
jgi:hypothetical protein